jgi:hypothetical protein
MRPEAVVVRQTYRARCGIGGIGICFVGLEVDGKAKIEGFLDKAFADQLSA